MTLDYTRAPTQAERDVDRAWELHEAAEYDLDKAREAFRLALQSALSEYHSRLFKIAMLHGLDNGEEFAKALIVDEDSLNEVAKWSAQDDHIRSDALAQRDARVRGELA